MLGRWVKEHRESEDNQAFRGNSKLTTEQKEIKQLKTENKRLQMERDICTRKVVGWSMSSRMKSQLVYDALQIAIWRRQPKTGRSTIRIVAHSMSVRCFAGC